MKNHTCLKSHTPATWRSVSPVCKTCRDIGIGFNLEDGTVLRLRIPIESATNLVECLADSLDAYRSTSVSTPDAMGNNGSIGRKGGANE